MRETTELRRISKRGEYTMRSLYPHLKVQNLFWEYTWNVYAAMNTTFNFRRIAKTAIYIALAVLAFAISIFASGTNQGGLNSSASTGFGPPVAHADIPGSSGSEGSEGSSEGSEGGEGEGEGEGGGGAGAEGSSCDGCP